MKNLIDKTDNLKDEQIISNNTTILKALEKNGIITIQDVLELNDTNNLSRMNTTTKRQVCGIIELLKYKYAKEDLLTALILTKKISTDKSGHISGIDLSELYRLGFTRDDINTLCLYNFGDALENNEAMLLVDFFRIIASKEYSISLTSKMLLYVSYYDEKIKEGRTDSDAAELEAKLQYLNSLYAKKNDLDFQIKEAESQLQTTTDSTSKGKAR